MLHLIVNKTNQIGNKRNLKSKIDKYSVDYSKKISLSSLYYNEFKKCENKIVITASFQNYVRHVFVNDENVIVYGSKLNYDNKSKVCGLKYNLYGKMKKKYLLKKGHNDFTDFYTDSMSDKHLFSMSKNIYMVNNGKFKKYNK